LLLGLLASSLLAGCGRPHPEVAGPSDGFAVAGLSRDRVAVLKGDDRAKAIFVVDLHDGHVVFSFGVPKESTDVAAAGPYGPLLVTTGKEEAGHSVGSLEFWTLGGTRTYIIPLPAYAMAVTHNPSRHPYVLVRNGRDDRVAVPIDLATLTVGRGIPLASGSSDVELCSYAGRPALLYAEGSRKTLALNLLESADILHSSTVAEHPICFPGGTEAYAITHGPSLTGISIVALENLAQVAVAPASLDAAALAESSDRHLIALNAHDHVSSLETFPDSAIQAGVTPSTPP
jgi:hypothetical protein